MVAEFTFMLLRRGRRSTFESDENDGEAEKAQVAIRNSLLFVAHQQQDETKKPAGPINIVVYLTRCYAETTFSLRVFELFYRAKNIYGVGGSH
jgi:hypothetical protein